MSSIWSFLVFACAVIFVFGRITMAIQMPHIVCPEYFQYVCHGEQCMGKVTLRNINLRTIDLEVQLLQMNLVTRGNYGSISLIQDESNIVTGQLISYRVMFPTANVLPRVTRIKVNENVVCQSDDYLFLPPFSQTMYLKHHLELDLPKKPTTQQLMTSYYRITENQAQGSAQASFRTNIPLGNNNLNDFLMEAAGQYVNSATRVSNTGEKVTTEQTVPVSIPENPVKILSRSSFSTDDTAEQIPKIPRQTERAQQLPNVSTNKQSELAKQQCAYQRANLNELHGGYATAQRGSLPWLAAVYRKDSTGILFSCDGALISLRTVLTAAQCLQKSSILPSTALIFLGWTNLANFNEAGIQIRTVDDIIMHPEYLKNGLPDADIALIQLKAPAISNDFIRPICLWGDAAATSATPVATNTYGKKAIVAGWSVAAEEQPNNIPRIAETTFVSTSKCQSSSLNATNASDNAPAMRTLCTEFKSNSQQNGQNTLTNTCLQNKSGSALLMDNNDQHWQLRAIMTSPANSNEQQSAVNSENCQATTAYVTFCDLAKHHLWLLNLMQF